MRVLKWIINRVRGHGYALESPIGWMPRFEDLDWTGSKEFSAERFSTLMGIDREAWKKEALAHEELFIKLYDRLPKEFIYERELLLSRLWRSPEHWEMSHE